MNNDDINNANNKKNIKIYVINIFIILAILAAILIYIFNVEGIENIKALLQSANYAWILLGALCLVGMWLAEAITIHLPLKKLYPNQKFLNSVKITMVGQLFNNITPFASGGQPMQAYVMHREGKIASNSLSILSMKFVITQTTLIIFTIAVVLSQFSFFAGLFQDLVWIGLIGIILNIILVAILIVAGYNKNFVMKITLPILKLISKIHIGKHQLIKNIDETIQKFDASVTNFSNQFKNMVRKVKTLKTGWLFNIYSFIYKVIQKSTFHIHLI